MTTAQLIPSRYTDKTAWAALAKPSSLHQTPTHRWFVYPHSYSHTLVQRIIGHWGLTSADHILDPFVGAGTTLLSARQAGIAATGLDVLPLSVLVSNVKVRTYSAERLEQEICRFFAKLPSTPPSAPAADLPLLQRAFSETAWRWLAYLKARVSTIEDRTTREFFLLAMLRTARQLCGATSDGGWLRWSDRKPAGHTAPLRMRKILDQMIADVRCCQMPEASGQRWSAKLADVRFLPDNLGQFTAVICSPPYPNRHDYSRVFAPELLTGFVDGEQLKQLRYASFRSHIEARDPEYAKDGYRPPQVLSGALDRLGNAPITNPRVIPMVEGYFRDTFETLRLLKRHLQKGAKLAFVVGNVRHAGVMVEVDECLARIGESLGYRRLGIWVLRLRGNSAQQMGVFGRTPARESIVFLQK
jgi:hypothetical protein